MKKLPTDSKASLRDRHNESLIRRMRDGEQLTSFDSQSSWFPPRQVLEKDSKEIARLYGTTGKKIDRRRSPRMGDATHQSIAKNTSDQVIAIDFGSSSKDS